MVYVSTRQEIVVMGYCPIARAQKFGEGIISILAQSTLRSDNSAYAMAFRHETPHRLIILPTSGLARCNRILLALLLLHVLLSPDFKLVHIQDRRHAWRN